MIWRTNLTKHHKVQSTISQYITSRSFWKSPKYLQTGRAKTKPVTSTKSHSFFEGCEVEGFNVTEVQEVTDFNCKLIRLNHVATGTQYAHVDRHDSNNVFGIAFRTTPFDSTGLPHILEHITLMGSEKYPCRDPFFKMCNRSLATYLNASTAPDFTVYPFATQNKVDYYNLMSVYLDAVFKPKLRENDFKLEGWRLEHTDVDDPKSPIVFKGVVFNEMKGVLSENQNIFMENIMNNLLPSHTYAVNSGGDPLCIPKLTYQNLVEFQRNHYHPSNSRIYSYGNFDLVDHLKFVNENYLKDFTFCETYSRNTVVPPEPRWSEPRRKHLLGKYDPLITDSDKQSILAVSYLCVDIRNIYDLFELKVLAQLLIDGPNAQFYKNLIEPNIGSAFAPGTGMDTQTRDTMFTVGLQGLSENDFEKVESIVYATFNECIANGFDETNIENVLHGIELNIKHQGSEFGINLLYSLSSLWNHDGNLVDMMRISEHVQQFRKRLKEDKFYLQRLLEKYFKNNSHRLILSMSPDKTYEKRMKQKEEELLHKTISQLSNDQVSKIYKTGLQLRSLLEKQEDISCLPTLKIEDISTEFKRANVNFVNTTDVPVQVCTLPTNNVTYFRSLVDVSQLSDEAKSVLPLFVQIVTQMGTNKHDYRIFDQMVLRKTLGLNVGVHVADDVISNAFQESISFGSLCLDQNITGMFDLWSALLNEVSLTDVNRFTTLVRNIAGDIANGVADSGHRYAMLYASSRISFAGQRREQLGGMTFIQKMKKLANIEDLSPVLEQMRNIAESTLNKKRMQCALNVSERQREAAVVSIQEFMSKIRGTYEGEICKCSHVDANKENGDLFHFVLPFAVNYVAKSVPGVPYTHPDFATLRVMCKLLSIRYLLPLVRERYGAYGAGAVVSPCGTIMFYSYRDPNSVSTASIFDEAITWLTKNEFTEEDIDEAKLGVFRDIDAPIPPCDQGMRLFLNGISEDMFAEHRLRVLKVNREQLLNSGAPYLNNSGVFAKVLIGPENKKTDDWKKIYSE